MKKLFTLALLLLGSTLAWSQAPEQPVATEKKQIVIIKKTIDEDGNEVVEKIVREVGEEEKVFFIEKEGLHEEQVEVEVNTDGDQVKVWVTEGKSTEDEGQIHVIRMHEGEEDDVHFEWKGDLDETTLQMLKEKGVHLNVVREATGEPSNKAFLGVHIGSRKTVEIIDGEKVETIEGESDKGVQIMEVVEGSAAAIAGLQAGDVITAVEGKAVQRPADLTEQLSAFAPGDAVSISYLRAGAAATTTATLGAAPAQKLITVDVKGEEHVFPGTHDIIVKTDEDAPFVVEFEFGEGGNYFYSWSEEEAGVPFGEERTNLELEDLKVYPNPTAGELNLQFSGAPVSTEVTLVDRTGKVILKEVLKNFDGQYNRTMNLKDVAADQLFLVIRQGDKIVSRMVVLQK